MADYIEPVKIEELPDKESLENSDFFIAEDSEDTKKLTFEVLKNYVNDKVTLYFGVSSDALRPPSHDPADSAILGQAILGQMILGDSAEWSTEFPTELNTDDYIWVSFLVEHPDGEEEWSTPFCLMDQDAKEAIIEIQKELAAAQADILKNSGLIEELSEKVTANTTAISENTEKTNEIEKSLEETSSNVSGLEERVSTAEKNIDSDGENIQSLKNTITEQQTKIEELESTIESLQENKSNLLHISNEKTDSFSLYAGMGVNVSVPCDLEGYIPLEVINYYCSSLYGAITKMLLTYDEDTPLVSFSINNTGEEDINATVYYDVLYIKE